MVFDYRCGDNLATAIRWVGTGGQGIVFAGMVLAKAAALYENREGRRLFVNQTQSYEPGARGEVINCDVVVSQDVAFYPFVEIPDYLVAMSQLAYDKFCDRTDGRTIFILDEDAMESRPKQMHYLVPAVSAAEDLGRGGSANMIMLGALIEISSLLSEESVLQAITNSSPSSTGEMNKKAFTQGVNIGRNILASKKPGESG
jgi:2-oxoglutarate ferredoxin oxidoreductase subunit gamma